MKSITTNAVSLSPITTDLTLAPTAPGDFREELKNLKFTNGGDADWVADLYEKVFALRATCTRNLKLAHMEQAGMRLLVRALPAYTALQKVHLDSCSVEGSAADDLVAVLCSGAAPSLQTMHTRRMRLQDVPAIKDALEKRGVQLRHDGCTQAHIAALEGQ